MDIRAELARWGIEYLDLTITCAHCGHTWSGLYGIGTRLLECGRCSQLNRVTSQHNTTREAT